jgi:acetate kinase
VHSHPLLLNMKVVLAVNAGSSSVKVSVYSVEFEIPPTKIAEAEVSGLTAPPAKVSYIRGRTVICKDKDVEEGIANQDDAFKVILRILTDDSSLPEIEHSGSIHIVCHRIVHGGDYTSAKVINKDTYHHLEELSDLAPLHNGAALKIVKSCFDQLPHAINVAAFDSQFHATIPEHVYTYPINPEIAKKNRLRKYGFHGLSYSFITRSVAGYLKKDVGNVNIIALHLGSGASACAVKNGKSCDTSMGLTPLAGLPGATRSGSVDPR